MDHGAPAHLLRLQLWGTTVLLRSQSESYHLSRHCYCIFCSWTVRAGPIPYAFPSDLHLLLIRQLPLGDCTRTIGSVRKVLEFPSLYLLCPASSPPPHSFSIAFSFLSTSTFTVPVHNPHLHAYPTRSVLASVLASIRHYVCSRFCLNPRKIPVAISPR